MQDILINCHVSYSFPTYAPTGGSGPSREYRGMKRQNWLGKSREVRRMKLYGSNGEILLHPGRKRRGRNSMEFPDKYGRERKLILPKKKANFAKKRPIPHKKTAGINSRDPWHYHFFLVADNDLFPISDPTGIRTRIPRSGDQCAIHCTTLSYLYKMLVILKLFRG